MGKVPVKKSYEFELWIVIFTLGICLWGSVLANPLKAPGNKISELSNYKIAKVLNPTPVKLSSKLSSVATAPPKLAADGNLLKALPDCSKVACLALTFDDGPNPNTTPEILNILEEHSVAATFFVVGIRIPGHEDLLQRMQAGGQEIGNHSWSHPNFTKLTPEQIKQQINQTQAAVVTAGVPAPTLFRPPYGAINQTVIDNVPLTFMFWNEDPKDWAANTPEEVVKAVEASAKPGGVIELHDIYHVTTNALPKILDDLTAQGFHFVTVSQLLNLTPETRGQFYGRHQPVL